MTNRLALLLGLFLVIAIVADQFWNDGVGALFMARKFAQLIEWLAFWR